MSKFSVLSSIDAEKYGRTEGDTRKLVLRMLSILGYDIFNPDVVAEEQTCDVGMKRNEKVDFALLHEAEPWCLIEVKRVGTSLHSDRHKAQIFRYFGASKARIGILTDGVTWEFYSDSSEENVMDLTPFHSLDIRTLAKGDEEVLDLLGAGPPGGELLRDIAHGTVLKRRVVAYLMESRLSPSPEFLKLIGREACGITRMTQKRLEELGPLVKEAIETFIDCRPLRALDIVQAILIARELYVVPVEENGFSLMVADDVVLTEVLDGVISVPGHVEGPAPTVESLLLYQESIVARYRQLVSCGGGVHPYCMRAPIPKGSEPVEA